MQITKEQLQKIAPTISDKVVERFLEPLNVAMEKFGITDPVVQAMFLAQILHESGGLRYVEEIASGKAYEGRKDLHNVLPGDGVKYKGRGLIQITGRENYTAVSMALDIDALTNPEILEEPTYAAQSAAWYWNSRNLSSIAIKNTQAAFELVTRRINGGLNGLADRKKYWERAKKVLGV